MNIFSEDLKMHATKIINYGKKGMIPLTNKEKKSYRKQKVCYICKKEFSSDNKNRKYNKVRDHFHYTGKYRGDGDNVGNLKNTKRNSCGIS